MQSVKILFALLVFCPFVVFAQDGYRITYTQDLLVLPVTFNGEKLGISQIKDRLVFNDSLAMSFRLLNGVDPANKKKLYGTKLVPHGVIYNSHSDIIYNMFVIGGGKGTRFMSWDSLRAGTWMFFPDTKEILGYTCKAALSVNKYNDTTLVWYTEDIPKPFGPYYYVGFPGVVLEVADQQLHRHMVAIKIEKDDFVVVMPAAKLYPAAEIYKMHEKGVVPSEGTYYKTKRQ